MTPSAEETHPTKIIILTFGKWTLNPKLSSTAVGISNLFTFLEADRAVTMSLSNGHVH